MKVAMWALGMLVLSLFGFVLVNLFGNITITDQLNYTTMKNTIEAAMYDSLDVAHYRAGFCLCTNKEKTSGKWSFNSESEYELSDIKYDDNNNERCESTTMKNCEILYGEYRVKPKAFSESLVRRFAEMVNNNKDYSIIIQDIIEYPPKVSVRIISADESYSPTEKNSGGYDITNQLDAILETKKGVVIVTPKTADEISAELKAEEEELKRDYEINPSSPQIDDGTSQDPGSSTSDGGTISSNDNCNWHAHMSYSYWTIKKIGKLLKIETTSKRVSCNKTSDSVYGSASAAVDANKSDYESYAKSNCVPNDTLKSFTGIQIEGHKKYNVVAQYDSGSIRTVCSNVHSTSTSGAVGQCEACRAANVVRCEATCFN